jgi:glycine cleavage system regulatory protein
MDDGTPSALYDQLKDATSTSTILGVQIKSLYADLYAINTEIHTATEAEVKGAISRVTGRDADGVGRIYNTFKALCNIATFDAGLTISDTEAKEEETQQTNVTIPVELPKTNEFHYNIQIHLPATNDISVYNAIFKSLKDNLLM